MNLRAFFAVLIFTGAVFGYFFNMHGGTKGNVDEGLRANDDNIGQYVNTLHLFYPEFEQPVVDKIREFLATRADEEIRLHYDIIVNKTSSYLLHTVAMGIARTGFEPLLTAGVIAYPQFIAFTIALGFGMAFVSAVAFYLVSLLRVGDPFALRAALIATGAILLMDHIPELLVTDQISAGAGVGVQAREIVSNLIGPFRGFSPFWPTPRGAVTFAVIFIFVMRWSGHGDKAYQLFPFLVIIHTSQAALLFAVLLMIDFVTRSEIFLNKRLVGWIFVTAGLIGVLETKWSAIVGSGEPTASVAIVVPLALVAIYAAYRRGYGTVSKIVGFVGRAFAVFGTLRAGFRGNGEIMADLAVFVLILSLLTAASMAVVPLIDPLAAKFFFGQVPVRLIAILRMAAAAGIATAIVLAVGHHGPVLRRRVVDAGMAATFCLVLIFVGVRIEAIPGSGILPHDMVRWMFVMEKKVAQGLPTRIGRAEEHELYYAVARRIDRDILSAKH